MMGIPRAVSKQPKVLIYFDVMEMSFVLALIARMNEMCVCVPLSH